MGVLSNKVDREQLKPGDHIYSWRQAYIYAHHGIYVGDGMVIHFTRGVGQEVGTGTIFLDRLLVSSVPLHDTNNPCPRCGDQSKKEGVISSCLDCFLYGGNLYLFEYGVSTAFFLAKARGGTCTRAPSDPTEDVLHRASFLLEHGFGGYDVFKKNCEDFAIYCKTGLLVHSEQAASYSAAASAVVSTTINFMTTASSVSGPAMVGCVMYSYCVSRLVSDIGVRNDAFKVPVESLLASPGLNEPEKAAEVPVEMLIASPGLNELEKTSEVSVESLKASPGLNEPDNIVEVPVESLKASPGLNEPENKVKVPVDSLKSLPGLNEPEKITEVPVEMLIASPGLNEPEKTTDVPMENLIASPSLNEPEKTTKMAKENQHWLNRGSGNRVGKFGYRGGGRGQRGRRPFLTCQVCLKSGHLAYNCLKASPGLNEPEKTAEVPVEMLIASPGLNEPEKTTEVPMENLMALPSLNEPEKTTKMAKENQHWLNRGSGNRGGRFGYRGGGRGRRGRRPFVTHQVCLKSGHSAYNCLKASPGLNEPEKTTEVPVEMLIASPGLNELEKITEVPMENLMASPGLNEPEKTTKTAKENQHWLNRGSGNRGGRFGYRGGGRGRVGGRPSVTCQVCLKSGHLAYNCLKASPGLNETEKIAEVPVEMLIASLGLNELEKTTKVQMENLMASPGLNELEKTTKMAKENQHWLNRGSGNRGGRFGYRGGGRGQGGRRPSVTCQVCLKSGHSAYNCYYRFDYNYLPRQSPQPVFPPGFRPHSAHLAAMPTTRQVLNDKSWFPDSGATNHVTADRENLVQTSEYNGSE